MALVCQKAFLSTTLFTFCCAAAISKLSPDFVFEGHISGAILLYILCQYAETHGEARRPHEKLKVKILEL